MTLRFTQAFGSEAQARRGHTELVECMKQKPFILLLLFLLSLPAIISLFHPGFFQSDDGEWMIIRFSAFHQAFRDGEFPVRWLGRLNHGYGYPVANFLYPGFMYLSELPKVLGFGFVDSIKIILGFSIISSAVFAYLWLSKLFDKTSAFIGALFYLYTPYHLWDTYKRGSVGEVLALAVAPFILWAIERKSAVLTSLGIALLILSHNTLALLFLPIIILYALLKKTFTIYYLLFTIFLGFGLSAFFWIPAIFDLQYTRFSQTQVSNWQEYFVNFDLIGWGSLVILTFTLFTLVKVKRTPKKLSLFFFFVGIAAIFLSLSQSSFLWKNLPVAFVQFPFRFLSLWVLSTAYLTAYILSELGREKRWVVGLILVAALFFSALPYTKPAAFFDKGEGFYATNEGTTTVQDEYLPKWVKDKPTKQFKNKIEIVEGSADISNLNYNSKKVSFNINSLSDAKIRINTIYFPGWEAFIDGRKVNIQYGNEGGIMDLSAPKGEHKINLIFSETQPRLFADCITLLSFIILVTYRLHSKYNAK